MFGVSLSCQLIQGPAVRTWNCVAYFANLLWYKFNHARYPIMPRSRRRHSRSRSRSRSYERDREPKRRKIESFDSQHKRSLSPEDADGKSEEVHLSSPSIYKSPLDGYGKSEEIDVSSPLIHKSTADTDVKFKHINVNSPSVLESPPDADSTYEEMQISSPSVHKTLADTDSKSPSIHTIPINADDKSPSIRAIPINTDGKSSSIHVIPINTDSKSKEMHFIPSSVHDSPIDTDGKSKEVHSNSPSAHVSMADGKSEEMHLSSPSIYKSPTNTKHQINDVNEIQSSTTEESNEGSLSEEFAESEQETIQIFRKCYVDLSKDIISSDSDSSDKKKTHFPKISSTKPLTPKQIQRRLFFERQREEKQKERDKKRQKALEEKMKLLEEKNKIKKEKEVQKLKEKQEKMDQKRKETELKEEKKRKEREERELKRKEKDEKDEQKRKEKEEKDEIKRKEFEEKQKQEEKKKEKKQKAAAAFVNFFTKKADVSVDEKRSDEAAEDVLFKFMPFEIKSDMRLAPTKRNILDEDQKIHLMEILNNHEGKLYLDELKEGCKPGKSDKTWMFDDDDSIIIIEEVNPGQSIEEPSKIGKKMRAKFLMFDGNRRPPYYGTWRKQSKIINPRKPFATDKKYFDYEIDSDDEWEEESVGESLQGSDNEDKENESDNEYEVDNEFFVPHGHLSDDEVNDEEDAVSPEAHKAKLKLLKKEFEQEMQEKMHKIKPRVIGCIWFNKNQDNIDKAIHDFLKPFAIISKGPVHIRKRNEIVHTSVLRGTQPLNEENIPEFLKFIHGSTKSCKSLSIKFLNHLVSKNADVQFSKCKIMKQLKEFATWTRRPDGGPVLRKRCWFVNKHISDKYNVELSIPN